MDKIIPKKELSVDLFCDVCKVRIAKKGDSYPFGNTTIYCDQLHKTRLLIE